MNHQHWSDKLNTSHEKPEYIPNPSFHFLPSFYRRRHSNSLKQTKKERDGWRISTRFQENPSHQIPYTPFQAIYFWYFSLIFNHVCTIYFASLSPYNCLHYDVILFIPTCFSNNFDKKPYSNASLFRLINSIDMG